MSPQHKSGPWQQTLLVVITFFTHHVSFVWLFELQAELVAFLRKPFLLERQIMVIETWVFGRDFHKKWACHFKEYKWQWHHQWWNSSIQVKIKILENWICDYELDIFLILKDFPNEIDGDITSVVFWCCIMKCVNIWNICVTQ